MRWRRTGALAAGLWLAALPASAQPPAESPRTSRAPETDDAPFSVDRVRERLGEEPAIVIRGRPVFRSGVTERRPYTFEMDPQFAVPWEPRPWTSGWNYEFLNMVTPEEARPYSPMLTGGELGTIIATSLAQRGLFELIRTGFRDLKSSTRESRERAERRRVAEEAAIVEWEWEQAQPPEVDGQDAPDVPEHLKPQ